VVNFSIFIQLKVRAAYLSSAIIISSKIPSIVTKIPLRERSNIIWRFLSNFRLPIEWYSDGFSQPPSPIWRFQPTPFPTFTVNRANCKLSFLATKKLYDDLAKLPPPYIRGDLFCKNCDSLNVPMSKLVATWVKFDCNIFLKFIWLYPPPLYVPTKDIQTSWILKIAVSQKVYVIET